MITLRSKIIWIIDNKKADHYYCEESRKLFNTQKFHTVLFLFQ